MLYRIRRNDAPYSQIVCLFKSRSLIVDPLFDAGELSLLEGLEDATGMTAQGYFTTDGLFIPSESHGSLQSTAVLSHEGSYYALYLLR